MNSIPKNGFKKKKLSSSGPISNKGLSDLYSYLKSSACLVLDPSNFISNVPILKIFVPWATEVLEYKSMIIKYIG